METEIRNEYPRPHLVRNPWQPLNGQWEFEFDDAEDGEKRGLASGTVALNSRINVPFAYQTPASGINSQSMHEVVWYRRTFRLDKKCEGKRILLCFNAVDYEATVWVNGRFATCHEGGYTAFECDITPLLTGKENTIVVKAVDRYDTAQPRGKQFWKAQTDRCWYHGTTGIWQSVWLEAVGVDYFSDIRLTPDIDKNNIYIEAECAYVKADRIEVRIDYKGKTVKTASFTTDGKRTKMTVDLLPEDSIDEIHLWSPENPNLYDITYILYAANTAVDCVSSYFGMRKVHTDESGRICLNNVPLYQKLILDQGYWQESGLTPPSAQSLKEDIAAAMRMGFNGARKHQKIEDPYFYYYADQMGFLVWAEMPSAYCYTFDEVQRLSAQYLSLIRQTYNFPSVIAYVPLNESWGIRKMLVDANMQDFGRAMYYLTKAVDDTRLVSTNDGWENVSETDFASIHDYTEDAAEYANKYTADKLDGVYPMRRKLVCPGNSVEGKPVIMTEFGGIAVGKSDDAAAWGYNDTADNAEEFYRRYANLLKGIYACNFVGFCYTQLTDVYQEVNGLLDMDHRPKFDPEKIARITDGGKA